MGIFDDHDIGSLIGPGNAPHSHRPSTTMMKMRMTRGRRRLASVGGAIAIVLLAACAESPASPTGGPSASIALPASPTALPRFTPAQFRDLLVSLRGKPVVVNIWASWCGPCKSEAPGLAREATRLQGKVQFLGVDIIDHLPPARAFIRKYGWPYPSVFDPTGAIRDDLGFIGQPITVVYDASGKQAITHSGAISAEDLREAVEDVLSGSRG
jgi:cytochrome c biogenesis protein CcmG, thiol:disulfide interchange protein DsbE